MSETDDTVNPEIQTPVRSKELIEQEYSKCATQVGIKQFQSKVLQAEIDLLCEKMLQLKREQAANEVGEKK